MGVEGRVDSARRVAHLMSEGGGWDEGVVRSLFNGIEYEAIINTESRGKAMEDCRWWGLEAKGNYTVRSCYLSQVEFYTQHAHLSNEDKKVWSRLVWQVSIPPKVKVFMWRACRQVIPTMGNLREHHVPLEGVCSLCKDRWATTEHALFFCPKVRGIWKTSGFWHWIKEGAYASFVEIAAFMEKTVEVAEYGVWCILVWKVWGYVCEVMHGVGGAVRSPTVDESWSLWDSYQSAKIIMTTEMRLGVKCGEHRWTRPPIRVISVDVDSMYNEHTQQFGVGVILRDCDGRVRVALSKKTRRMANAMIAE